MSLMIWSDLADSWGGGDFRAAHDWLNAHWSQTVEMSHEGERDPFARFLQGLAFSALAFHFSNEENRESAELFVNDALKILPEYMPAFAGVQVQPVLDALDELQDRVNAVDMSVSLNVLSSVRALNFSAGIAV